MKNEILKELIDASIRFGSNSDFTVADGGNTSVKDGTCLYIKASGCALAQVSGDDFVALDLGLLSEMWKKNYPEDCAVREGFAMHDICRSRCINEEKRPSNETALHALIQYKYVVHTHPALVNGLTCSKNAAKKVGELFPDALWVDTAETGFRLAEAVREKNGEKAKVIFVKNHGVFVSADTLSEIDALYESIMNTLKSQVAIITDDSCAETDTDRAADIAPALRMLLADNDTSIVTYFADGFAMPFATEENFSRVSNPPTLFHLMYYKAHPLFVRADSDIEKQYALIESALSEYEAKYGEKPSIIAIEGLGFFAHGKTKKAADIARDMFCDAAKIAIYANAFGGVSLMSDEDCSFILSLNKGCRKRDMKRAEEKIVIVTGGAQGIGFGIVSEIIENGANVVIADLNDKTADAAADELCKKFGRGKALSCKTDVSNEESVKELIKKTVLTYGGIDAFVNNAGIVRAGSLEEMTVQNLDFVTKINYTAYFICAKYASRPMKIQNRFNPSYSMDIIQINSKSGLNGSNKNFAYAGSKFGGIGLTQSFALELVPFNIKVNSICPGNFLEGPLWTDPEKGLFVQYLNAGKVPGAKTVDDVRRAYESKVPMNRGCRVPDVARAVLYCMEQQYETGQAIPVTGGQNMLK